MNVLINNKEYLVVFFNKYNYFITQPVVSVAEIEYLLVTHTVYNCVLTETLL